MHSFPHRWRDDGSIARARATLDAALGTWQEKYMSWVEHTGLMVGPLSTASREEQLEYMMFQVRAFGWSTCVDVWTCGWVDV